MTLRRDFEEGHECKPPSVVIEGQHFVCECGMIYEYLYDEDEEEGMWESLGEVEDD